ncbi:jg20835 [Pararge aegeria aegeria]|uniref:Jg20835 protein n=1 Tax=Pararge aegeria aegeria TaxID=348720 RepID=A0A8S4QKM7_9NEOP|nr:jg20835 [Pararge aegeria aegeria]
MRITIIILNRDHFHASILVVYTDSFSAHHLQGSGPDREIQQRVPGFLLEDLDFWGVPNTPSYVEDTIENGLQTYDA